uniref:RING-type E3 ubiquitin transferase n=1 Tax=Elaeis guineensis var. tenera TaxID=51953 RepID=A0A6I9QGZ7_ELAGV|nr:U-box domain-containing protein 8 [Elaeis guineensis]
MEVEFPDDFRCPISLEVMSDPVILSSGHTFDRASIQRWIDSGNRTCPVTKLPLPPRPSLIPNHALRSLISNFVPAANPKSPPSPSPDPHNLLASLSFPADADTLAAVLRLSKRIASFRRLALDAGAASVLLRHAGSVDRPDLQDLALRALLHLSLDGDDARVGLVAEGAVDRLDTALRSGPNVAALAATCLTSLAMVEVNKCTIGAHPSAIAGLAALLREGEGPGAPRGGDRPLRALQVPGEPPPDRPRRRRASPGRPRRRRLRASGGGAGSPRQVPGGQGGDEEGRWIR